jgi:SnoaL-like domain
MSCRSYCDVVRVSDGTRRTDVTEFLSLLDPEVELQTAGGPRLRGHDQPAAASRRNWRTCSRASSRIAPSKKTTSSRRTEVRWIESGEIAREFESAAVFWFRDGKIVRWQPFDTYDAALKAAGLAA